jgi:hypothetical protein
MKLMTRVATIALTAVAAVSTLKADTNSSTNSIGTGKDVKAPVVAAPAAASPLFNLSITEEYDSRYIFRGVNVLPNTGILWTTFAPVWHITANDSLTVPVAYGTAVGKTFNNGMQNYRELDVPVNYAHTFGNLTLGAGYQLYAYFNVPGYRPGGQGIQNEVNVNAAYAIKTGAITWTPSLTYYYELGTAVPYSYGSIYAGSSYLSPQLTVAVPVYKDIVSFNPNVQYNFSFRYSENQNLQPVTGVNNFQISAPVSWQINKTVSVTGYVAYSYQPSQLIGAGGPTAPSTVWGGANVTLSF